NGCRLPRTINPIQVEPKAVPQVDDCPQPAVRTSFQRDQLVRAVAIEIGKPEIDKRQAEPRTEPLWPDGLSGEFIHEEAVVRRGKEARPLVQSYHDLAPPIAVYVRRSQAPGFPHPRNGGPYPPAISVDGNGQGAFRIHDHPHTGSDISHLSSRSRTRIAD